MLGSQPFAKDVACPVCSADLGVERTCCPRCDTPHHPECWKYNQGCAVFGCMPRPVPQVVKAPRLSPSPWTRWILQAAIVGFMMAPLFYVQRAAQSPSPDQVPACRPAPVTRAATVQGTWQLAATIDPQRFDRRESHWSGTGPSYEGNPAIAKFGASRYHAFGGSTGQFAYRVDLDRPVESQVRVSAALSSELPGYGAPAVQASDVHLIVNGYDAGVRHVSADDGAGSPYHWHVASSKFRPKANLVVFSVVPGAKHANGLCIYGKAARADVQDAQIRIETAK